MADISTAPSQGLKTTIRHGNALHQLQAKSEQMREYVDNLEQNLGANKELVHELLMEKFENQNFISYKHLKSIIQDNQKLFEQYTGSVKLRQEFQGKALMNQQVTRGLQLAQQETQTEYEEKLTAELHTLDAQERRIQELHSQQSAIKRSLKLYQRETTVNLIPLSPENLDKLVSIENKKWVTQRLAKELHRTKQYVEDLQRAERRLEARGNRRSIEPVQAGSNLSVTAVQAVPTPGVQVLSKTFDQGDVEVSGLFYESSSSEEAFDGASFQDRFKPLATGKKPRLPSLDLSKLHTNPKNATDSNLARLRKSKYALMMENQIDKIEERIQKDRQIVDEISLELMGVTKANAELDKENEDLLNRLAEIREQQAKFENYVRQQQEILEQESQRENPYQ